MHFTKHVQLCGTMEMTEYRDRNISGALIQKLYEQFDKKFTEYDIKKSGMFF